MLYFSINNADGSVRGNKLRMSHSLKGVDFLMKKALGYIRNTFFALLGLIVAAVVILLIIYADELLSLSSIK